MPEKCSLAWTALQSQGIARLTREGQAVQQTETFCRQAHTHLEPLQDAVEALILCYLLNVYLLVVWQRQQRPPQEWRRMCLCQAVPAASPVSFQLQQNTSRQQGFTCA